MKLTHARIRSVLILMLASCTTRSPNPIADLPRYGGTLNVSCLASLENLDPQTLMFKTDLKIASLVYEGLTAVHKNSSEPEPCLAESWQIQNNGTRLIFHLRKDVFFHDDPCFPDNQGRQMTADDIVHTFKRIASKETNCIHYYLFADKITGIEAYHSGKADSISGITCINDFTVAFDLVKPYISFIKLLATSIASIIPHEAVTFYGENFKQHPVGTGAFRLARWQQLDHLLLVKNKQYWRKGADNAPLPYLDALHIKLISNPVVSVSELYKGSLHIISLNAARFVKLKEQDEIKNSRFRIEKSPSYSVRFLGFSMDTEEPTAQYPALRKAIAYAFNRTALINPGKKDVQLKTTFAPAFLLDGYNPSWYTHDLKAARQFIAAVPDSIQKKPILITANLETQECLELVNNMKAIGLNAELKIKQVRYYPSIFTERPHIFRVSFQPTYPDPEEYYALFDSRNTQDSNVTGYHNPRFDDLLESARLEQDKSRRNAIFRKLEEILRDDVPALLLAGGDSNYYMMPAWVHGLQVNYNLENYAEVWIGTDDENRI